MADAVLAGAGLDAVAAVTAEATGGAVALRVAARSAHGVRAAAVVHPWLADKREPVLDLATGNFTHFDNVLNVDKSTVRLIRRPEQLVFVSAKTRSRAVAPWLAV